MTEQQIAAVKQALAFIEPIAHNSTDDPRGKAEEAITALRRALEQQYCRKEGRSNGEYVCDCKPGECLEQQPAEEPVAFPAPKFEAVADGVEVGYDLFGGVDIRLGGEFVYVHINYDYRYTDNASRRWLAEQIVGLLTRPQPAAIRARGNK